jgi:16S rRNA (cytosine1402-N4)-methyltransferase
MEQGNNKFHQPVLLQEVVASLNLKDGQTVVDGTLGLGGYSEAVLKTGKKVKIVAFDLDRENLDFAKNRLADYGDNVTFVHNNFAEIASELQSLEVKEVDGLMLDLGLASPQVDQAGRGFSFSKEGDLDMRFDQRQKLTAAEVVNKYSLDQLTRIFREYGEERSARKAALAIVEHRIKTPFTTTKQLADFIQTIIKQKNSRIHPATRIFQALRIEVNRELESLQKVLTDSVDLLAREGRIAVVSYHSLEDRIVKNFFRDNAREFINLPDELTTRYLQPKLKIITKKPIVPGSEERAANPRSRSAKLRVAEKI